MQDPASDPATSHSTPSDIVESLRAVSRDMETFVWEWAQRLDRAIESSRPAPLDDAALQKRVDQLEKDKQQWESERDAEQQACRDRIEQITDAWLQLETEQRAFLQKKAARHGKHGDARIAVAQDSGDGLHHAAASDSSTPKQTLTPLSTLASQETRSHRDDAARQFKRLRREIDANRSDPS